MRIATMSDSWLKLWQKLVVALVSPGVSLHEWLDEDSKESLKDKERINNENTVKKAESDLRRYILR